jgi:predicted AAA+ superfamily ATPase
MSTISRAIENQLSRAAKAFSAVVVTGPRRSGKTWLLRHQFPKAQYYLFEDPDVIGRFRADPQGFLDAVKTPVILDEIQNVPEVFNFVRSRIDREPSKKGQWLLTGSQESSLMQNVSESMAGRAAILQMLPLSLNESNKVSLLRGGYPEVVLRPNEADLWFSSYTQTYLERDVRNASAILSLETFRRFMSLLATRHGAVLNMSEFAAPLGVSVPTVSRWLDILETSGLILRLSPFFENVGKRLIKAPKIYWLDSGLVCHLLGIRSNAELERSPFLGAIFEGAVASEIIKSQVNQGQRRALYYFRDQQGLEVDFIKLNDGGTATFIEAKATRSPQPNVVAPMIRLAKAWNDTAQIRKLTPSILVHRAARNAIDSSAIAPGCRAMTFEKFAEQLG